MGEKKYQLAIDAVALIIHKVYKIQEDKQIADTLYIKQVFDYVFCAKLL